MAKMGKSIDTLLATLLFATPLIHLLCAPYTKVEESFNMQAAHDILVYGTPTSGDVHARLSATYDHFTFPGAVPRTFLGAVLLAGLGQPLVALAGFARAQLVVRAVLGAANATALLVLGRGLRRAFGRGTANWWVVMMVGQFHVNFYLSRTLPNMYAFGLTTLATAFLLPQSTPRLAFVRQKQAVALLILAGVIFRCEVALLLATTTLFLVLTCRIHPFALVPVSLGSIVAGLAFSVPIDSYFWQRPVWPELAGFYYNAVLGSSSNWGTSPWHYYFSSALPRLLLNPLVPLLVVYAALQPATSRAVGALVVPNLLYVAVYSLQPHKEARFVFYVIPALTAAAALGANHISSRLDKSLAHRAATLLVALSALASVAASAAMLLVSSLNYPGGEALSHFRSVVSRSDTRPIVSVHADVFTCMTGMTLFGQNPLGVPVALGHREPEVPGSPLVLYDKTEVEYQYDWPVFWERFDYALLSEADSQKALGRWEVMGTVLGYDGIDIITPKMKLDEDHLGRDEVVGLGARVLAIKDFVRERTGGWWIGPRLTPRIYILKQDRSFYDP